MEAHEDAFRWYGGIPREIVYDQDNLIVVSENGGDLILTKEFEHYKETKAFKPSFLRWSYIQHSNLKK
ncbi:hypothetical protein [Virgibacillus salarius]|uniref:hypothetical protein n=1 Tax=Virgibacillus salarius TaxID=447199 RepID=UPI003CD0C81B